MSAAGLLAEFRAAVEKKILRTAVSRLHERQNVNAASCLYHGNAGSGIRDGIAADGRRLSPLMPRFEIDDASLMSLTNYLHTLSAENAPGVTDETIHFAVVVEEAASGASHESSNSENDAQQRQDVRRWTPVRALQKTQAMMDVVNAFVERHNLDVQRYRSRKGFSTNYKEDFRRAWRQWKIHVWEVSADSNKAPLQLKTCFERQPVFALLSGFAESWQPIHEFCNRHQIPSLFPNTSLPGTNSRKTELPTDADCSLYLCGGVIDEAKAVADHLSRLAGQQDMPGAVTVGTPLSVTQIVGVTESGRRAAAVLTASLKNVKLSTLSLDTFVRRKLASGPTDAPDVLVLWVTADEFARIPADRGPEGNPSPTVIVCSSLVDLRGQTTRSTIPPNTLFTWPWALPEETIPEAYRVRGWLRSRRITMAPQVEAVQLNTYFALSVTEHSLRHMVDYFSREYLIERIEHETENHLNPGVFPRLSLAPGQRIASRRVLLTQPFVTSDGRRSE